VTPARVAASRAAAVRRAARAWERAGVIDAPTRSAIEEAHPSDAHTHAPAWRVVIFVIATVAICAAFAAFAAVVRGEGPAAWLFFGAVLAGASEAIDRSTLRGNGAAGATSFWAVVSISVGCAGLADSAHSGNEIEVGLLVATLAFACACWRWGYEVYGAFGAVTFFLLLARFPGARAAWVAAALLLLAPAFRRLDRSTLAPEHRCAAAGVFAVSAVALYAAVNRFSVDRRLIETLRRLDGSAAEPAAAARTAAAVATALLPIAFLAWGIRSRRRLVLDLGLVFSALSLATLREYVHLGPLWAILCAAGATLLLATLALNRRLRRAPDGEWAGFTERPLYSGAGTLSAAAVVAGFAPDARLAPAPETTNFTPGGGSSGGGGATGSF
jgi:hypothetical protein